MKLRTVKKVLFLCIVAGIVSCASSPTPFQLSKIEPGVIYKFNNPTLSTSLYVKFLAPTAESRELLFKTAFNSESVRSLEPGLPGVRHQKVYQISERGKISFHYLEEGQFEEMYRYHQYANSGAQQDAIAIFRYRLDIKRATVIQ